MKRHKLQLPLSLLVFVALSLGWGCKRESSAQLEPSISTTCDASTELPADGNWPREPVRQGDGSLWQPYLCFPDGSGGVLVVQNTGPSLKPMNARYSPLTHEVGSMSLIFREGTGVDRHGGVFVSTTGWDMTCVNRVEERFDDEIKGAHRYFPGERLELQAERFEAVRTTGQYLPDLSLYFALALEDDADTAAISNAYNRCAAVDLAEPSPRIYPEGDTNEGIPDDEPTEGF